MYSNEFKDYLKNKANNDIISTINYQIDKTSNSFTSLKQEIANMLSQLFMENDNEKIAQYINYGKEINNIIELLSGLKVDKDIEKETVNNSSNNNIDENYVINTDQNNNENSVDVIITKNKLSKCDVCKVKLEDKTLIYKKYKDKTKTEEVKNQLAFVKECPICKRKYMTEGTANSLYLDLTNINPIQQTTAKCRMCGAPVWNNTHYCWEHYKHEYYESK